MKNVAIIEGGYSHEKVISLLSSETVYKNIDRTKYNPIKVRIDEEGWYAYDGEQKAEINRNDFSYNEVKFDFAFIVIHGTPGEDGKLQAYFDMLGIPYSTCGQLAATLTFNKFICNQYLKNFGVKVAEAVLIRQNESFKASEVIGKVGLPCFVKPADGGSSFGVTKVKVEEELNEAVSTALEHGTQAIIESFMEGREMTNGIYLGSSGIQSLPVTEIVSENDFFDFDAKYKGESNEITPAEISDDLEQKIKLETKRIYQILDLKGICRADYIIQNGEPYLIEINTVPGMSDESLIPQMAAHEGVELVDMLSDVMKMSLSH
jgi:D-alanine-D-alanine ligase